MVFIELGGRRMSRSMNYERFPTLYQAPLISTLHFRHGPATVRAICRRTWRKGARYWLALTIGMVRQSQRRLVLDGRTDQPFIGEIAGF
jgi:hypothetical protein